MFVTQRESPTLALIQPQVEGNVLILNAPNMKEFRVDLTEIQKVGSDQQNGTHKVKVWDDVIEALAISSETDAWFSEFLSKPVMLVSTVKTEDHHREF